MTTMDTARITKCTRCGAEKAISGKRLPTGWKRVGEDLLCDKCKNASYALRAVTIPIVSPIGMSWPDLRKLLRPRFAATTQAANWVIRQLAMRDPGFDAAGKIQKMPMVEPDGQSLYLGVASRWPDLDTRTACCIVQAASAKYRELRLKVLRGVVSCPSIRYPHPIPCHNATWSVTECENGGLHVDLPIGRKLRVTVRLKGGPGHRRALGDVRRIMRGEAVQGQLDIFERGKDVMVKMIGWFPKTARTGEFVASMHTGGDAFLTLYNDERRTIYRWNADHVRRRIMAQDEQMQRLREDMKAEERLGRERDGIRARMKQREQQHHDYMHSFCHEVSKQVIGHLQRRRCSMLMFVDKDRSYMPHFPWAKLSAMLTDKANRANIEIASGDAVNNSQRPLEVETQQ